MNNKVVQFSYENDFVQTVTDEIVQRIEAKEQGKVFRLALSGGSTPGPMYQELARRSHIDWSRVELYLVDERYVPVTDELSNRRMIEQVLISHLVSPARKWIFFDTALPIDQALSNYESQLDPSESPFFDLILLGMGTDGHTASLFPGDPLLQESVRWVGNSTKGNPVPDRLTLTYPALECSREIFFCLKA